jgi:hypothetical protein
VNPIVVNLVLIILLLMVLIAFMAEVAGLLKSIDQQLQRRGRDPQRLVVSKVSPTHSYRKDERDG